MDQRTFYVLRQIEIEIENQNNRLAEHQESRDGCIPKRIPHYSTHKNVFSRSPETISVLCLHESHQICIVCILISLIRSRGLGPCNSAILQAEALFLVNQLYYKQMPWSL